LPRVERVQADRAGINVTPGVRAGQQPSGTAALAKGLGDLASGLQQRQTNIDNASAEEAAVAFEREKNDIFFNPESGYLNTSGRDAFEGAGGVKTSLDELKKKHSQGLSPAALQSFGRIADNQITRSIVDIDRHSSKNLKAWELSTINASVENTLENASLYWNDAERLGVQRELGRQSILDAAQLSGDSVEATNEKLQNFESSFSVNAVSNAIDHGSQSGKEALNQFEDRLEPNDLRKLQNQLKKREEAEQVQRDANFSIQFSRRLIDQVGDQPNAKQLINQALREINDPKVFKATRAEVDRQLNDLREAQEDEKSQLFESAADFIQQGASIEDWKLANNDGWNKLTAKQKQTLEGGDSVETDYDAYSDLLLLPQKELALIIMIEIK